MLHRFVFTFLVCFCAFSQAAERPNILWITSEDNGPMLGCYGDKFATTPNLDALASKSLRYLHAWSVAPVCAPARTTIISGIYPSSSGSEHMRSQVKMPTGKQMFPQFLRDAGYYCTNRSKEDYNLIKPGKVWDESSAKAHFKNRAPGQPFFAVVNFTDTHESQTRGKSKFKHDPDKVTVPAYHPDCLETRQSWAQCYDQMTVMDAKVGALLAELKEAGLEQDTIVFYYADHGPGLPRAKRTPCNSGLQVPMILHIPDKWKRLAPKDYAPGAASKRLVSFIDLAPTVLALCGIAPPDYFQGQPFAGDAIPEGREFNYGLRGRMDERLDLVRSVTDGRYVYLRNYMPQKPSGQHVAYMFQTPMTRAWERLYQEKKLPPHLAYFWQPKAAEELYDLHSDPAEIQNLANKPDHAATLQKFRAANRAHMIKIRDVDLLPEAEMLTRAESSTPYDFGHDATKYPLEKILAQAESASLPDPATPLALRDPESGLRYWSVQRLLIGGLPAIAAHEKELVALLADPSPNIRISAAEALAKFGSAPHFKPAVDLLFAAAEPADNPTHVCVAALNAIDELDAKVADRLDALIALGPKFSKLQSTRGDFGQKLMGKILADLKK